MIDKQLKVGDHIVSTDGCLYVIEAVNKASYRAKRVDGHYGSETVPLNGVHKEYDRVYEYFVCDDVQLKIIAALNEKNAELQQKLRGQEEEVALTRILNRNLDWLCHKKLDNLALRPDPYEN